MVQAADQPAEIHLVLDEVDARPGGAVAGAVRGHEQHAGDELHQKHERQATAPDVAPLGPARDVLDEQHADQLAEAGSMVEPVANLEEHVKTSGATWRKAYL